LLAALLRIGWSAKHKAGGSHTVLERDGWDNYVFAFHDRDEIGPKMLSEWRFRIISSLVTISSTVAACALARANGVSTVSIASAGMALIGAAPSEGRRRPRRKNLTRGP
jgi:predicted RNA binding protein YcfA (HicA-like mRNA interferase family)